MDVSPNIRATIVDDEPLARLRIRELLKSEEDIEVIGEYRDARTAAAGIRATQPDLLFLDVQMPRGSAFTILQNLAPDAMPATIFVTAHATHALQAFEFRAVDYLLKPFDTERFQRSLERARWHLAAGGSTRAAELPSRLAVRTRGKVYLVKLEDVDWIETAGNYVRLHVNGATHLYRDSLVNFEARLDPQRFVKVHRSTIVNVDRITQLEPSFRREHILTLCDGTRLTLSAPYRNRLQSLVGPF
jgi:two-component system LytT family response regulator